MGSLSRTIIQIDLDMKKTTKILLVAISLKYCITVTEAGPFFNPNTDDSDQYEGSSRNPVVTTTTKKTTVTSVVDPGIQVTTAAYFPDLKVTSFFDPDSPVTSFPDPDSKPESTTYSPPSNDAVAFWENKYNTAIQENEKLKREARVKSHELVRTAYNNAFKTASKDALEKALEENRNLKQRNQKLA